MAGVVHTGVLRMNNLLLAICLSATVCTADAIKLSEVYIQGKHFTSGSRNVLITENGLGRPLRQEANLVVNTVLFDYVYWNNRVHSQLDDRQFRVVGWDFQVGVGITNYLSIEYGHFSKHLLDYKGPWEFPVEDYIGFKLYLYKGVRPVNRSIFE